MKKALAVWLAIGVFNVGVINGSFRHRFNDLIEDPIEAKDRFAFSLVWSIPSGPIGVVIGFVESGMWSTPYTWSWQPAPCVRDPQIWCGTNKPVRN